VPTSAMIQRLAGDNAEFRRRKTVTYKGESCLMSYWKCGISVSNE
jgi:hypothetical protein